MKIETLILPFVLYGCGNWFATWREEHEFGCLRRVFWVKREKVIRSWEIFCNCKFHNFNSEVLSGYQQGQETYVLQLSQQLNSMKSSWAISHIRSLYWTDVLRTISVIIIVVRDLMCRWGHMSYIYLSCGLVGRVKFLPLSVLAHCAPPDPWSILMMGHDVWLSLNPLSLLKLSGCSRILMASFTRWSLIWRYHQSWYDGLCWLSAPPLQTSPVGWVITWKNFTVTIHWESTRSFIISDLCFLVLLFSVKCWDFALI